MVLTYPAQGHINPLLQFSKRLASKGLKATLATTHYTVNFIQSDAVGVEAISDGFDEGGFKQAPSLEAYLESFQAVGSRTVGELILKFNESASPVDCLVYDSILPWGLSVARQFGIYGAAFWTTSASVCSMYWQLRQGVLSLPVKQEHCLCPCLAFLLSVYPICQIFLLNLGTSLLICQPSWNKFPL